MSELRVAELQEMFLRARLRFIDSRRLEAQRREQVVATVSRESERQCQVREPAQRIT